jgi:hypothetical protein
MKARPILMSAPMVRATLANLKRQTRRVQKLQPGDPRCGRTDPLGPILSPYGQPGDQLWVRETFVERQGKAIYRATPPADDWEPAKWTPSIFMPRWASRITLEVKGIRVERLKSITDEDAIAEGIIVDRKLDDRSEMFRFTAAGDPFYSPRDAYFAGWDWLNGKGAAAKNPWVWVIEFKRVTP